MARRPLIWSLPQAHAVIKEMNLWPECKEGRWFLECINYVCSSLSTRAIARLVLEVFTPR
jgi:hypothetical protein